MRNPVQRTHPGDQSPTAKVGAPAFGGAPIADEARYAAFKISLSASPATFLPCRYLTESSNETIPTNRLSRLSTIKRRI
jgi:hypothetical protein